MVCEARRDSNFHWIWNACISETTRRRADGLIPANRKSAPRNRGPGWHDVGVVILPWAQAALNDPKLCRPIYKTAAQTLQIRMPSANLCFYRRDLPTTLIDSCHQPLASSTDLSKGAPVPV
jgi:hypothetical protein